MRIIENFCNKWAFTKQAKQLPETLPNDWDFINLPHTWNAIDGQDGGNDYYRGKCYYAKNLNKKDLPISDKYYLEFLGANSITQVFVNGKKICTHCGGYSTFRCEITDYLEEENLIVVTVDNSQNDYVYPQMADFTFYGGIYRDVNIICVSNIHFELDYFGSKGINVTPTIDGSSANIKIDVFIANQNDVIDEQLKYVIKDKEDNIIKSIILPCSEKSVEFNIENVHLWDGKFDPYLYTAEAYILRNNEIIDNVSTRFGCRSFEIDSEKGFILNSRQYPLRGVSRHQDRWGYGNALTKEMHDQDMALINELGANTIRLAHYQHDQYFYDLCDEYGIIVWAEIPYISTHLPNGTDNTITQMKELIVQNYNHPSIVVWGLSNEITIGEKTQDLVENHIKLNDLCHKMDKTRKTAIAVVSMCDINDEYIKIPDVVAYNHYFGWYGGDTDMNGPWFDNFHKQFPNIPIGVSEYGCEGLNWHTSNPTQGDYTEEYQAFYHEELIKQLFSRQYLWATYVWNMFDFGADARCEGGENGQNHKGLVTFDRKYKKDAFYAYKAWLSSEPFVHICGKRYVQRNDEIAKITIYSNLPSVELFANGKSLGVKKSNEHFFYFDVENVGTTNLKAVAGNCVDNSVIIKVDEFNDNYRLKENGAILNWFDVTQKDGFYSLNDKLSDIMKVPEGKGFFQNLVTLYQANNESKGGFEINEQFTKMLGGFTVLRLINMFSNSGVKLDKDELLRMNEMLNNIKKE